MSPVPRERLPYPDLPSQRQERAPGRAAQPAGGAPQRAVVDRQSQFDGTYRSEGDLLIEGTFEGQIDCKGTVIVAEGANVSATIQARNVVIAGSANGEFSCDERFTIQGTGEMRGKAQAATLVVEEGAFFEGEFKMGAGGFGSVGGNFSSWQSARPPRNGSNRPGSRQEAEDEGQSQRAESAQNEGPGSESESQDPWS